MGGTVPFMGGTYYPPMGESKEAAEDLEVCRVKRNMVEYDLAGVTSATESKELIDFTEELREEVLK